LCYKKKPEFVGKENSAFAEKKIPPSRKRKFRLRGKENSLSRERKFAFSGIRKSAFGGIRKSAFGGIRKSAFAKATADKVELQGIEPWSKHIRRKLSTCLFMY